MIPWLTFTISYFYYKYQRLCLTMSTLNKSSASWTLKLSQCSSSWLWSLSLEHCHVMERNIQWNVLEILLKSMTSCSNLWHASNVQRPRKLLMKAQLMTLQQHQKPAKSLQEENRQNQAVERKTKRRSNENISCKVNDNLSAAINWMKKIVT